jgi:hypothetical protein
MVPLPPVVPPVMVTVTVCDPEPEVNVLGEGEHEAMGPLVTLHVKAPALAVEGFCHVSVIVTVPFAFTDANML